MAPRILTAATSFVDNTNTIELVKLWFRAWRHLNPGEDIILIDACSPFDPSVFLPNPPEMFRWEENIGAISRGAKDGAGRSFCKAIELAQDGRYDYVCVYETDFILARAIRPIIERMAKAGVKVASPGFAAPYQFPEWGVVFLDVKYAIENKVIERYGWQTSPIRPIVEMRLETLFGDDLWFLPLRGVRNEQNQVNVGNIANMFPYQMPAWLTHCADPNLYFRMLELNGVHLP